MIEELKLPREFILPLNIIISARGGKRSIDYHLCPILESLFYLDSRLSYHLNLTSVFCYSKSLICETNNNSMNKTEQIFDFWTKKVNPITHKYKKLSNFAAILKNDKDYIDPIINRCGKINTLKTYLELNSISNQNLKYSTSSYADERI
jgi:hypothetical protein